MTFLGWNAVLSAWLLLSAFALPHTAASTMVTAIAAFLTLAVAAFAVGRPAIRYLNGAMALGLAVYGLLSGMPAATAIHNAIVAAVILALSAVSPVPAPGAEETAHATGR